jgi:DNA modification methylase
MESVFECLPELSAIRSEHPAVFPVKLPEEYIKAMTKENDYVIEPFGGSGTTLIACEKTNRKCRIMELDPIYCDVIRRRYTQWAIQNNKPLTSGCLE